MPRFVYGDVRPRGRDSRLASESIGAAEATVFVSVSETTSVNVVIHTSSFEKDVRHDEMPVD